MLAVNNMVDSTSSQLFIDKYVVEVKYLFSLYGGAPYFARVKNTSTNDEIKSLSP